MKGESQGTDVNFGFGHGLRGEDQSTERAPRTTRSSRGRNQSQTDAPPTRLCVAALLGFVMTKAACGVFRADDPTDVCVAFELASENRPVVQARG